MPLLDPIPLTVVAGGAEMPSLLAQLRSMSAGVAMVVPEGMADIGTPQRTVTEGATADRLVTVVPDMAERSPGCMCCRVRLDLVDALAALARRRSRPAHILVAVPADRRAGVAVEAAAGPLADRGGLRDASSVTAVAHTVLSDPDLRRRVRLDGVVATLDAVAAITRLRTGSPMVDAADAERLAIADRLVMARSDQVVGSSLLELREVLGRLNRIAPVLSPAVERVAVDQLLSIDAWHGAPDVLPAIGIGPAGVWGAPDVPGAPEVVVIEQRGMLDPGGVEEWLDGVLVQHAPRLVRLQGALAVDGSSSRVCCHGVGSYAMSHPEHEHRAGRRSDTSLVVLIGHGLPADELAAGLRATAVR